MSPQALDRLPRVPSHRRRTLIRDQRIPSLYHLPYRSLHKTTLTVPTPQENCIHDQQNPASLCENDGRKEDAEPEEDFERGNEHHAGVVVFFHEFADCVGEGGGFVAAASGGGVEGWENIGAGVGRNVENGIDHEREKGEGDLAGEEPEERHSYSKNHLSMHCCCWRLGLANGAIRTEILNIFISSQSQRSTLLATCTPLASAECFVDDNTVGCCCCHEGGAIRETGPARVEVESDVGEAIAERAEEERDVSNEPAESVHISTIFRSIGLEEMVLKGLGELQ